MDSIPTRQTHIAVRSAQPFDEVIATLDSLLQSMPASDQWSVIFNELVASRASWHQVTETVQGISGPSGFLCMVKVDLGPLLSLQGRKKQLIRYVLGNPVLAYRLIERRSEAGLYVPMNLVVYQDEGEPTTIVYDLPSALLGQLQDETITEAAQLLDSKLAKVVATAARGQAE